jgi:hypothetical protein
MGSFGLGFLAPAIACWGGGETADFRRCREKAVAEVEDVESVRAAA